MPITTQGAVQGPPVFVGRVSRSSSGFGLESGTVPQSTAQLSLDPCDAAFRPSVDPSRSCELLDGRRPGRPRDPCDPSSGLPPSRSCAGRGPWRWPNDLLAPASSTSERVSGFTSSGSWAQSDLNRRPPGYQPGAPAKLSYGPATSVDFLCRRPEHGSATKPIRPPRRTALRSRRRSMRSAPSTRVVAHPGNLSRTAPGEAERE